MFAPSMDEPDPMSYGLPPFGMPMPPRAFRRWGSRGFVPPFLLMRQFGPWGGRGPRGGGRMFGRGDLKFALLDVLKDHPAHGYELIKELANRAGGFYTPSAGAVYPTLQMLEDRGWVTSETVDGKKVYSISDAGRQALSDQRGQEEHGMPFGGPPPWFWGDDERGPGHHGHHHHGGWERRKDPQTREAIRELAREARETAMLVRQVIMQSRGNPEQIAKLREVVKRTKADLLALLNEQQAAESRSEQTGPSPAGGHVEQI
jgi:DNA-binding PadR family transcriptional regulator